MHVVGARPNLPKAAPVIRALDAAGVARTIVHTGQHYDDAMSASLIRALGMPEPDINLGVGSGTHAQQTAAVLSSIEPVLIDRSPALVVVYGDINSTLAAALAAAKLGIPVAHVEAGLRSHDPAMPEEINRRLVDHLSTLRLVTSPDAWENLRAEGLADEGSIDVGNPMIDSLVHMQREQDLDRRRADLLALLGIDADYLLATIHRPSNVDDPQQAEAVLRLLESLGARLPVVLPLHPRSQQALEPAHRLPGVHVIEPLAYPDFLAMLAGARVVVTDSGGVQEETSFLGVPCVTVRSTTERPVTITLGTNRLSPLDDAPAEVDAVLAAPMPGPAAIPLWDGRAGERIAAALVDWRDRQAADD
jgi:UDP-N-acetylglucosamine 2-epimerase (non-hydrolysing)